MAWLKRAGMVGFAVLLVGLGGCGRVGRQKAEMVKAIDGFYAREPACLWFEPVEFPVEVDVADEQGRAGLEALVGQGLMVRSKLDAEGEVAAGIKYELTEMGWRVWHPDPARAGFGNICYGVTKVFEVGSVAARRDVALGEVRDVAFLTELSRAPVWAMSPAVREAFPRLQMELTGPMPASATLQAVGAGWRVVGAPTHSLAAAGTGAGSGSGKKD